MKSKFTIALGVAALIGLAGCVDLKEDIVSGVTASYLETPEGLDAAVNATYSGLWNLYGQEKNMTMLEYGVDIWAGGADGSRKYFNTYTAQLEPRAGWVQELWDQAYRSINTANAVISRAATSEMPEEDKVVPVAEAKFLRAFYYFYLLRQYGDLAVSLEETQGVKTEAHRTPVAEVYSTVVIPDLQAAIAGLPVASDADAGRATSGAARHLLALVYLTRNDPGDAALAEQLGKEVIDSGQYSLMNTYPEIWTLDNEAGPEVIFSLQTTNDPLTWASGERWHLYWGMVYDLEPGMTRTIDYGRPFRRLRPSSYMLDSLFMRNADDRFDSSFRTVWFSNSANRPAGMELGDTAIFLPGVKTADLDPKYCGKPYVVYTEPDDFWNYLAGPLPACPNVIGEYNPSKFPTLTKYLDPTRISLNEEHSQRDFLVFRLADTYLMVAEALVRQNRAGEAVGFVNEVRERAAKPGQVAAMQITAADLDLDFILAERGRELFGEGHRWFDLVRFGKLVELVGARNADAAPNIQPFHVRRPIPQSQIDLTSNEDGSPFGQNEGY